MDIRPCPRCRKLVSSDASFCRRCGVAMWPPPPGGGGRLPPPARSGGSWASTLATIAITALGVMLGMFAVSGSRMPIRHGEASTVSSMHAGVPDPDLIQSAQSSGRAAHGSDPSFPTVRETSTPESVPTGSYWDSSAARDPERASRPAITSVVGPAAPYGHKVTIRGRRLGAARQVVFIGARRGRAEARFVVWDDHHLLAAVPDLGPGRQKAAVAVVTAEGVAVTVPHDAPVVDGSASVSPRGGVCVVPAGGVFDGSDMPLVFVSTGAAARAAPGATLFVRGGGSAWGRGGGNCLLFCERGVMTRSDVSACDVVEVAGINACVVPSLFQYTGR